MEAHVKTVREILHSGDQFLVPFFQRHYSWRREHWQRLIDDIVTLAEESEDAKHFLGPLVCTPFKPVPGQVTPYQLIDGQQRLATLTIALAALRDTAKLNALVGLADEIHEDYLVHRRRSGAQRFKVVPRPGDRIDYQTIIEGNPAGTTMTTGLLGAYSFFKREWRRHLTSHAEGLFRRYLAASTDRLSLVTITVAGENPYEIFESLNSTGLPLEESDLIRNFVFMQIALDEQDRFQTELWDVFERRFEAEGAHEKLSPTVFYRSYLMRNGNYCRNKTAYLEFKKQYNALEQTPTDLVGDLQKFASFELSLRRPSTCTDAEFRGVFAQILNLEITTAHPLLLHLLQRHGSGTLERRELLGCLVDLCSFVIRRSVCGESTRGYGRLFPGAIKAIRRHVREDLREFLLLEGWPDDRTFLPRLIEFPLYKRERKKCRLLLDALEREAGHKEELNLCRLEIEHVLPQAIEGDNDDELSWQRMLGHNWPQLHESWVHTLGNLTLTGYNPELGNCRFSEKKAVFAESNVSLNQHFIALNQWGEHEIKQRGEDLARTVAKLWPRPNGGPNYVSAAIDLQESGDIAVESPEFGGAENPRGRSRLLIRINWPRIGKDLPVEEIREPTSARSLARFLERLINVFGDQMAQRLQQLPVNRTYPLSENPTVDFLNRNSGEAYGHVRIEGTGLYVCTQSSTADKQRSLKRLIQDLNWRPDGIEIDLVD